MSILSKLKGTAEQTAGRSRGTGRTAGRSTTGRTVTSAGRGGGGTAKLARKTSSGGRAGAPATGGLSGLLSRFTKRR